MCTVLLPLGGYPIAVKYIMSLVQESNHLLLRSKYNFCRILQNIESVSYWSHVLVVHSLDVKDGTNYGVRFHDFS